MAVDKGRKNLTENILALTVCTLLCLKRKIFTEKDIFLLPAPSHFRIVIRIVEKAEIELPLISRCLRTSSLVRRKKKKKCL